MTLSFIGSDKLTRNLKRKSKTKSNSKSFKEKLFKINKMMTIYLAILQKKEETTSLSFFKLQLLNGTSGSSNLVKIRIEDMGFRWQKTLTRSSLLLKSRRPMVGGLVLCRNIYIIRSWFPDENLISVRMYCSLLSTEIIKCMFMRKAIWEQLPENTL